MKKYLIISSVAFLALTSMVGAQEYAFSQDISVGSRGDDVSALQSWLISNGYDIPAVSTGAAVRGYFGSQTREAVRKFQESEGLPTTGYFGRLSRGRIHDRWGNHNTDSRSPVINGVDAPTTLNVGETGTWTIRATDPQHGSLSYSIDWGDMPNYPVGACPAGYSCMPMVSSASMPTVQQGSTFTHSYAEARTYKVTFTVRNNLGLSVQSTATVNVTNTNASPLNIISPNGGEVWQKGTTQSVKWNSPAYFRATYADISIIEYQYCPNNALCKFRPALTYPIAKNTSINQNSFSWKVGDYIPEVMTMIYPPVYPTVPDGQYTVQICEAGTSNCDSSDRPFSVSAAPSPQVMTPNGGETWLSNSTQLVQWSMPTGSNSNTRLDLYLDPVGTVVNCITAPCPMIALRAPYTLDKNIPITMAYNWIVATDMNNVKIPDGSYTFRVCIAGSTTNCDSSDRSFKIVSTTAVPDVNITSPNGGQTYNIGSQMPISWKLDGTMRPEYMVWVTLGTNNGGGYILTRKATDATSFTWTVPSSIVYGDVGMDLAPGTYKVYIGLYDGPVCTGLCAPGNYGKLIAYDDSDNYITITR